MQGKKRYLDQEVTRFWLSERVPPYTYLSGGSLKWGGQA
ncbi:hypothetical protein SAMN00120144_4335 [Hymenobacter roseosalivarius DSM 11622]|uniref:Uncharacterized protein n=1 Tax=Hymenobacter roseosalivarius DSM 11622 TaxID=645990 RepID=A0A1W1UFV4_9BACT|nr:hypothetical protein SAMN00120144_4335 [Hymenobacter roseosalivarius DSM 11622]